MKKVVFVVMLIAIITIITAISSSIYNQSNPVNLGITTLLTSTSSGGTELESSENNEIIHQTKTEASSDSGYIENYIFAADELSDAIKQKINGSSYDPENSIDYSELLYFTLGYYGYDDQYHQGEMIAAKALKDDIISIFKELYEIKFPIEKMRLVDEYGGDDIMSMSDNNTSAFNDRLIPHTDRKSNHSYGVAIDINPKVNPYVTSFGISPVNGSIYADRSVYDKGSLSADSKAVEIFKKYGWSWGGDWTSVKDWQHFEKVTF